MTTVHPKWSPRAGKRSYGWLLGPDLGTHPKSHMAILMVRHRRETAPELAVLCRPAAANSTKARSAESATCLDRRWEPGDLGIWDPRALSGAGSLANRLPSPLGVLAHERPAARPAHPVRLWLKRGLRCPKLHCPPRLKMPRMAGDDIERRCADRGGPAQGQQHR